MLIALKITASILLLWVAICLFLWQWQERLIFYPQPVSAEVANELANLEIEIAATDGAVLRGWQHPGNSSADATSCQLILYFGGNSEEISWHTINNGHRFSRPQWYVNYRGFGRSDGVPSAQALRADALLVFDTAVKKLNITDKDVCVIGRSLGTHMAAHIAANRTVKKLIMITPFDSALNVAKHRYPILPITMILRHHFDTLAEAPHVSAPTLFLLADVDHIVPLRNSKNLITHWPDHAVDTVLSLPDTHHNNIIDSPAYWQAISDFLAR